MTTMAFRDGILAADTLYTRSGWKCGAVQKIWRTSDGRLLGVCGDFSHVLKLVEWLKVPPRKRITSRPTLEKDTGTVAEIFGIRRALFYEHDFYHPITDLYWTLGSGSIAALTAMDMGGNAVTAIKMAIKRDEGTGGRVRTVRL